MVKNNILRMPVSMRNISSEYIGAMCSDYRRYELKYSQTQVAHLCNVSRELVSKFERGSNSNARIFLFYIKMGIFDWVPIEKWCGWRGTLGE